MKKRKENKEEYAEALHERNMTTQEKKKKMKGNEMGQRKKRIGAYRGNRKRKEDEWKRKRKGKESKEGKEEKMGKKDWSIQRTCIQTGRGMRKNGKEKGKERKKKKGKERGKGNRIGACRGLA